jgi:MFS family permease
MGFFAFYITMALGRFLCDFLRIRFGRDAIVRASGLLAASGLALVLLAPSLIDNQSTVGRNIPLAIATIGFALTGCGLSTLVPTMFSTAGHMSGRHAGTTISTVAGFTYSGSIISSPLIGGISDGLQSLRWSLVVVAGLLFMLSPLGYGIPKEDLRELDGGDRSSTSSSDNDEDNDDSRKNVSTVQSPMMA